jgi:hypothetical protein
MVWCVVDGSLFSVDSVCACGVSEETTWCDCSHFFFSRRLSESEETIVACLFDTLSLSLSLSNKFMNEVKQ